MKQDMILRQDVNDIENESGDIPTNLSHIKWVRREVSNYMPINIVTSQMKQTNSLMAEIAKLTNKKQEIKKQV